MKKLLYKMADFILKSSEDFFQIFFVLLFVAPWIFVFSLYENANHFKLPYIFVFSILMNALLIVLGFLRFDYKNFSQLVKFYDWFKKSGIQIRQEGSQNKRLVELSNEVKDVKKDFEKLEKSWGNFLVAIGIVFALGMAFITCLLIFKSN